MLAAVVALVRGIVIFLKTNHEDIARGGSGPSVSGMKQNKMMQARIMFQAIAVLIVILLLMLGHGASSPQ
jgi:hypothetical protein